MKTMHRFYLGALLSFVASATLAAPVYWTDWISQTAATSSVQGTLTTPTSTINVGFSGAYSFAQTSGGTNYWNPSAPYTSATVDNAPPAADIIALNTSGTATVTFSQAVTDPFIALVSWNGNTANFGVPINILSFGAGFWGNGTPILNPQGDGFLGSGEVHGVIRLPGTYTSISFTHTSENWHGFTVGVAGLADNGGTVPEPGTLTLLAFGLLGLVMRQLRKSV